MNIQAMSFCHYVHDPKQALYLRTCIILGICFREKKLADADIIRLNETEY